MDKLTPAQQHGIDLINEFYPDKLRKVNGRWVIYGNFEPNSRDVDAAYQNKPWALPDNMSITGHTTLSGINTCIGLGKNFETKSLSLHEVGSVTKIEDGSKIGDLYLERSSITEIGDNVIVNGLQSHWVGLNAAHNLQKIGKNFTAFSDTDMSGLKNIELSSGLTVKGILNLNDTTTTVPTNERLSGYVFHSLNGQIPFELPIPADAQVDDLVITDKFSVQLMPLSERLDSEKKPIVPSLTHSQQNGIDLINEFYPDKLFQRGERWFFSGDFKPAAISDAINDAFRNRAWSLPDNTTITGHTNLSHMNTCIGLGKGFETTYLSLYQADLIRKIEDGSKIGEVDLEGSAITEIGDNVTINGHGKWINLNGGGNVMTIGKNFTANSDVNMAYMDNVNLSSNLTINGDVDMSYTTTIVPDNNHLFGITEDDSGIGGDEIHKLPLLADAKISGVVITEDYTAKSMESPSVKFGTLGSEKKPVAQSPVRKLMLSLM